MSLKAILGKLRTAAALLVDTAAIAIPTRRRTPDSPSAGIIRLDAIGDFILWSAAAEPLVGFCRDRGHSVTLIANNAWADLAQGSGIFDRVIPVERSRFLRDFRYRFKVQRAIREQGFSMVVQPTYSREMLFGDSIVRVSGASERIGSVGDTSNISPRLKRISDRWYSKLIPASNEACMELVRNAEFLRGLGVPGFTAGMPDLSVLGKLQPDTSFRSAVGEEQPYFCLFPGASWSGRCWPVSNFAQVADHIYASTGWRGVICGGPDDALLAKDLCQQTKTPLLNWVGRTSLRQLSVILFGARLLITNETASTHIAAASGTPTICILGGGHFGRFMPYSVERAGGRPLPRPVNVNMPCFGCNWNCIYDRPANSPVPCIRDVSVEQVIQEVDRVLAAQALGEARRS